MSVPRATNPPRITSASHQPLVAVLAAIAIGVVADRYLPSTIAWWWPTAWVAWFAWLLFWRRGHDRVAAASLLVSLALVGAAWHHACWSVFAAAELGFAAPQFGGPAAIEGRVVGAPRRVPAPPYNPLSTFVMPDRTRLELDVTAGRNDDAWQPQSGRVTLSIDGHLSEVRAGDTIRIFGKLSAVRPPANPGEYDFAARARGERRLAWLSAEFPECVAVQERGSAWNWRRVVGALRAGGDSLVWRNLSPGRTGLAAAMFLGSREELDPDETQAFIETGTIHLLVISGLNVGILAACMFFALRTALVPERLALAAVAAACVLYAATTDAQPPVVRATVMVLVGCVAATLGRRTLEYNSLAAAGLVVLAINPCELFQSGTQLSFLSVAALAWLADRRRRRPPVDPLTRLIARTRPWHQRALRRMGEEVWRMTVASAVIWLVISPLVMTRLHLVSPAAVALGPLLAVPVALAMAAGFGIFALGWLLPPLAVVLGWICDVNLGLMQSAVEFARDWPAGHFWVPGPSDWWLAGFYGALLIGMLAPAWTPPRRWCLGIMAGWAALGLAVPLVVPRDAERLDCTFLSVGHGAAVVLELPGGQTLLYDAGRLGPPAYASRAVAGYLWSRGITHLDAVVISHADADHYNALPALVNQFTVGTVYTSPMMFEEKSPALDALRRAIERADIPLREVWGGDRLANPGGAKIEVLHPPRRGVLGSDNANSIVLAIEYRGKRLLLTGDLEGVGMTDVVAEDPWDCDVLLAPHHGSAASDPPGTGNLVCGIETICRGPARGPTVRRC